MLTINKIRLLITRFFLWAWGLKFDEVRHTYLPGKKKVEFVVYDGEHSLFTAKATPINTIIAEKSFFKKYSKNVQTYLLAHEYGHTRVPLIIDLLFYAAVMVLVLSAGAFLLSALVLTIIAFFKGAIILMGSLFSVIFAVGCVFLVSLFSWCNEIYAEIYAIRMLGLAKSKQAHKEMEKKRRRRVSLWSRVMNRLTHPPNRLVFYIYEKYFH